MPGEDELFMTTTKKAQMRFIFAKPQVLKESEETALEDFRTYLRGHPAEKASVYVD